MLDKIPEVSVALILGMMLYLAGILPQVYRHSSQSDDFHVKGNVVLQYVFCLSKCNRIYVRGAFVQIIGLAYGIGGTICVLTDYMDLADLTGWMGGVLVIGGVIWATVDIIRGIIGYS